MKNHKSTQDCEGQSLAQTERRSHKRRGHDKAVFGQEPNFKEAWAKAKSFRTKYPTADSIPDEDLPESFDWRNIDGVDFTNPIHDQGKCGSCYSVANMHTVEHRLKLKYGKPVPKLSVQQMLVCNYMSEGCQGGEHIIEGFFAETSHFVTNDCAPYAASTKGSSCSKYRHCQPHSKVKKAYWLGRGYGDSSEKKIMKEVIRNGAVAVGMKVPYSYNSY